tara:strand:+ start:10 stop:378 length:369 start_codon:yes stop_codon:yes gene_type:complete
VPRVYDVLYTRKSDNPNNRGKKMTNHKTGSNIEVDKKELLATLMQMRDLDELRLIRSAISDRIKEVANAIKYDLRIGDPVLIKSPRKELKETGTIVKVNRTRAVVNISGKEWNVPFSLLAKQ